MSFRPEILPVLVLLALPTLCKADNFSWTQPQSNVPTGNFDESRFLPAPSPQGSRPAPPPPKPAAVPRRSQKPPAPRKENQLTVLKRELSGQKQEASLLKIRIAELEAQLVSHQRNSLFSSFTPAVSEALRSTVALLLPPTKSVYLRADPSSSMSSVGEDKLTDYATGVMIGKNIAMMHQRNKLLNISTDNDAVITGIEDYLNNRIRVPENELRERIEERESSLQEATEAYAWRHRQDGAKYTEQFVKRAGVHRSPGGFYYQLEKKGQRRIAATSTVDIQVTEKLIDGTVVNDMKRTGAVISQKLSEFPPMFKEAIELAGNGGVMTLVVPPELAYGDRGQPPQIPPGATMIYQLSVVGVRG
ncbi:FKBP-type peptidyl-prolyl cis-trans isomerase [Cedecea sp.]|jgi:FKBP-type peptidyl-prolyl cis-trans isomerase FkpA|uniref:FKBP-type peptidyl-prolyl cis-trans isomerase n=1 Tax=Cedecea sp. TaxID=1970739 RepID=UPI0012AD6BE9|nr:hypothetical protein [Enterobacteriaceae bacterium RIT693]